MPVKIQAGELPALRNLSHYNVAQGPSGTFQCSRLLLKVAQNSFWGAGLIVESVYRITSKPCKSHPSTIPETQVPKVYLLFGTTEMDHTDF